jgi:hypothetical protein
VTAGQRPWLGSARPLTRGTGPAAVASASPWQPGHRGARKAPAIKRPDSEPRPAFDRGPGAFSGRKGTWVRPPWARVPGRHHRWK